MLCLEHVKEKRHSIDGFQISINDRVQGKWYLYSMVCLQAD